jgi:hypothetical protein
MPRKIKDENGNEIEVYSQEELDAAKTDASNEAMKPIREKMGLKDDDDFDKNLETTINKAKERVDWEKVSGGKEKAKKETQQEIINQLKEKGIEAKVNESGEIVVDNEKQEVNNPGMTKEEAEAISRQVLNDSRYEESRDTLLGNLDEEKGKDVKSHMEELKNKGVPGDATQLFNMSLAALGVDAPTNMNNSMNNYPNNMPGQSSTQENRSAGDFADSPKGRHIMEKGFGMTSGDMKRVEELKDKPRMISEGRISNDGGRVANQHDVIK